MADDIKPQTEKPTRARSTTRKPTEPGSKKPAKSRVSKASADTGSLSDKHAVTPEQRYRMVAEAAYHHAEKRGFVGGDPLNDWLLAEMEVDKLLRS